MSLKTLARRLLASVALTTGALSAMAAIPASERQVLIDFYNSTGGDAWGNNTGWKTAGVFSPVGTECTWRGIGCDATETHVTGIGMDNNNLVGPLPANLNQLTQVQELLLMRNRLSGSIPSLNGLTALQGLYLNANELTGPIPSLSGLSALEMLYLAGNRLSGPIPSLADLTSLQHFVVGNNQLTGSPPAVPPSFPPGSATLCANFLHTPSATDTAWDAAVGGTWSTGCTPGYQVSTSAGPGGSISPAQGVAAGTAATVTVTPDPGFVVDAVGGTCGGAWDAAAGFYTTNAVTADCTVVVASFSRVAPVPAMGEWMLMAMGLLLGGLGVRRLRRSAPAG